MARFWFAQCFSVPLKELTFILDDKHNTKDWSFDVLNQRKQLA